MWDDTSARWQIATGVLVALALAALYCITGKLSGG